MAFIRGNKCGICEEPINETPGASLPHFVRNRQDPLFALSGRSFHMECFETHPLTPVAVTLSNERLRRVKRAKAICTTCGEEIHENWCNAELLTSDTTSPLYEFNFLHFHSAHLAAWPRFEQLRTLIEELEHAGSYEGPPICAKESSLQSSRR